MIEKVISGGQTGADRAGLDAALACGIPIGGWCPKGRKAEDGKVPDKYPLLETESFGYRERTRRNIEDADVTVIFVGDKMTPGTESTIATADLLDKPSFTVYYRAIHSDLFVTDLFDWLNELTVRTVNIAGPRESKCPGIYKSVYDFLIKVFQKENYG